jgi:hypothetical protein
MATMNNANGCSIQNMQMPMAAPFNVSFPTMNQPIQNPTNQSFSNDVQSKPILSNAGEFVPQQFPVMSQPIQIPKQFTDIGLNPNASNAVDFQSFTGNQILSNNFDLGLNAASDFQPFAGIAQNIQMPAMNSTVNHTSVADFQNIQMPTMNSTVNPASAADFQNIQMPTMTNSNVSNSIDFRNIQMPVMGNPNPTSSVDFQTIQMPNLNSPANPTSAADFQNIQMPIMTNSNVTNAADFQNIQMPTMNSNANDFKPFPTLTQQRSVNPSFIESSNANVSTGADFILQPFPAITQRPQSFTNEQHAANPLYNLNPMPMNMVLLDPAHYFSHRVSTSVQEDEVEKEPHYTPSMFAISHSAASEPSCPILQLPSIPVVRTVSESVLNRSSEIPIPWMPKDDEELTELVEQLNNDWAQIASKLDKRTPEQCHSRFQLIQQIRKNREEQQRLRTITDDGQRWNPKEDGELVDFFKLFPYDWKAISTKFNNRSPEQCQNRFYFVQRVLHNFEEQKRIRALNQSAVVDSQWNPKDEASLIEYFQQYPNDWKTIANKFDQKTPEQCFNRFQSIQKLVRGNGLEEKQTEEPPQPANIPIPFDTQSAASIAEEPETKEISHTLRRRAHSQSVEGDVPEKRQKIDAKEWQPEENIELNQYAETFDKDWTKVASKFESKTAEQCMSQWHLIQPRHGKWLAEEDEQLLLTFQNFVEKETLENGVPPNTTQTLFWYKVAGFIVGRSGKQCMARYTETLDPHVIKGKWSAEEDDLLAIGIEKYGKSWVKLSGTIAGRTQRQCRTRWIQLTKDKESKGKDPVEASDDESLEEDDD